jgi:hypothetical protein
MIEAAGIEAFRAFEEGMRRGFEEEHGITYAEVAELMASFSLAVSDLYHQVVLPDGTQALLRGQAVMEVPTLSRRGAVCVVPGWTPEQQRQLVLAKRAALAPRRVFPRLVAACVLDARARWGLLLDNQANRLMVGHHMRKQLRNGALRVAAVDANVSLALNLFFIPHGGDLVARGQALHWSAAATWRAYDLQGSSWWQRLVYTGHTVATPVV